MNINLNNYVFSFIGEPRPPQKELRPFTIWIDPMDLEFSHREHTDGNHARDIFTQQSGWSAVQRCNHLWLTINIRYKDIADRLYYPS